MTDEHLKSLINMLREEMLIKAGESHTKWYEIQFTEYIKFRSYLNMQTNDEREDRFFLFLPKHNKHICVIEEPSDIVMMLRKFEEAGEFNLFDIEKHLMESL